MTPLESISESISEFALIMLEDDVTKSIEAVSFERSSSDANVLDVISPIRRNVLIRSNEPFLSVQIRCRCSSSYTIRFKESLKEEIAQGITRWLF
jgi:hypothetical protein